MAKPFELFALGVSAALALLPLAVTLPRWVAIALLIPAAATIVVAIVNGCNERMTERKRGKISGNTGIARGGPFLKVERAEGLDITDNQAVGKGFIEAKDLKNVDIKRNTYTDIESAEGKERSRRFFGGYSFAKGDHLKKD